VLKLTSEISKQIFPFTLDLDNPKFWSGLDRLVALNEAISAAKKRGGIVGAYKRAGLSTAAAWTLARLYLMPTVSHELPDNVRLAPTW